MRKTLIFTFLLNLTTCCYCLSCVQCKVEGENFCQGPEYQCPKTGDFACGSTSTVTIIEGIASKTFSRSCERRANCGISGSMSYLRGRMKTATTCCFNDGCSPPPPKLPLENMQRIGLTCRSCTSLDSKWCNTEDTIDCFGEERKCILQTTTTSGFKSGQRAIRGCATNDLCAMGSQYHDYGDITEWTEVTCTNSTSPLQQSLLLLALAALLCIKLM
ncbi:phospholipase A2 inhibitor and Ly6/PLAUR domain-containing protein-like isoform X2 [Xenopus laevis]|uniref:Phospholipase A2 inhibitor and Ly6/PLAUR domain-containing protein-like isoform X2 n=1 Tax=Xenopus laevis TaxID=8355 RepID=A0A8J1LDY2_XENLA|nr:phospholipase A2 inhibitor and Ly6/PLAUR domain-containing protein-like isoform X2 [Xenopus laevis]